VPALEKARIENTGIENTGIENTRIKKIRNKKTRNIAVSRAAAHRFGQLPAEAGLIEESSFDQLRPGRTALYDARQTCPIPACRRRTATGGGSQKNRRAFSKLAG
jgi:hypothetical protein